MADTSALAGTALVGSAVVGSLGAAPPVRLRVHGECWELVTDPAAIRAAEVAAAGTRILDRAPTPGDGAELPVGAGVIQQDPETGMMVAFWRWDGTEWQQSSLSGDAVTVTEQLVARVAQILQLDVAQLIVTEDASINQLVAIAIAGATAEFQQAYIQNLRSNGAAIDEAVIGDLAANIITSGLFRTAAEGQRLEIDSNGLIMWGVDGDGVEYEMVRIGPSGLNLLTIGETTVAPTGVASPSATFGALTVGGDDLTTILDRLPRGLTEYAEALTVGEWDGADVERWRLQLNFVTYPGRHYRIRVNSHYVQTRSAIPTTVTEFLRWKDISDGVGVTTTSPQIMSLAHSIPRAGAYTIPSMEAVLDGSTVGSRLEGTRTQVVLSSRPVPGQDIRYVASPNYPLLLTVEDIGPSRPATGRSWIHLGAPSQGGTGGDAPGQDRMETYTRTYTATGYGGDTSSGDVVQGQYSRFGNRSGGWAFPSMTGDLAGATIEWVKVYLYATHWYYSGGGTASIRATDGTYKGHTGPVVTKSGWPRYAGQWVTLPASMHDGFKSGLYKGIGVQTSNTSLEYYGRFAGLPSDASRKAKIQIRYRK